MKTIAMIPARMGSQRLKQKNLQKVGGLSLISRAIRKSIEADVFDEIWVNSDHFRFKTIALKEGVNFHQRPESLSGNSVTSEAYIYEFLKNHHCDYLVQVHTITPLLLSHSIGEFVGTLQKGQFDVLLSVVNEQIECVYNGKPVNFSFWKKTNSQQLVPVQRIVWGLTGWLSENYIQAYESGNCATYWGRIGFFPLDRLSGHMIKTREDLEIARILFSRGIKKKGTDET
jgi:CMP-N-acetylneuraminic acid synthetase